MNIRGLRLVLTIIDISRVPTYTNNTTSARNVVKSTPNSDNSVRKTFQYKAKISPSTERNALEWLYYCRKLYNACLQQKIDAYKRCGKYLTCYTQSKELPGLKAEFPEYKRVGSQVLQDVVERLDRAYLAFFQRVKRGEKAGLPRFRGQDRYDSFTLKQCGWKLDGRRLRITNVGTFKLYLSRPVEGDIKTVTIKHSKTGKWFIFFSCDNVPEKVIEPCDKEIGIDMGLKVFLADSNGNSVENPRFFRASETILRRRQRSKDRKKKGSKRREKTRLLLARVHEKITNQRKDFLNKTALKYIQENGTIYVEDLRILNMVRNKHLSKSIMDASWGRFLDRLSVAAVEAKRKVVRVDPKYTSQTCSHCGYVDSENRKSQSEFVCKSCGFQCNADHNAAINILRSGQDHQAVTRSIGLVA